MSVFKRDDSPFYYSEFQYKRHRFARSTRCASRREAEAWERDARAKFKAEIDAKKPRKTEALTIDQACGRYWREHGRKLAQPHIVEHWLKYIVSFLDKSLPLGELSTAHVTEMVAAMHDKGIGPVAINRTVTCLQGVHNRAGKLWEEPVKVIAWKAQKSKEQARTRWITQDDARRFLAALPEHIRRVVLFLLTAGLRRNEAFTLTWDQVSFETATITQRVKGGHTRHIPVSSEALAVLRECPQDSRYVFDTTNWRKHFEKARQVANVDDFRWHDLRHTFATWLGQSGAPLDVIREVLGHSSITVTQKYRHVAQKEVRAALQRVPLLSPNTSNVVILKKDASD